LFDYETHPEITATVSVEGAQNTGTVTISLNDLDEISSQDFTVAIDENPTDGEVVGTIAVTGGGTLSHSLTSQTPAGALNIDANTGELTVADANLFDFETNPVITANITVDNGVNTVMVVATVKGTASFSITSQTPMGALNIDANTGELTVADPNLFDFETNPVITANITVDNGVNTVMVVATVNPQTLTVAIDENPTNGDVIGTIQTTGSNLTFSIAFQNPAGAFNIDATTGELTVADETLFDFETMPNMLATVSVGNSVNTVSVNAMISINDLNELGEYKHGGLIFWIDATDNSQGLVFAFNNQLSDLEWGCSGTLVGATGTAIGSGAANTAMLISSGCSVGGAAETVSNLNVNGFDDWFLPSVDEMNEIGVNYATILWPAIQANGGSALLSTNWTSTEGNNNQAYIYYLTAITSDTYPKSGDRHVIPVRAF